MTASLPEPEFDLFMSCVRRDVRQVVGGRSFDVVVELKRELEKHRQQRLGLCRQSFKTNPRFEPFKD
jgi:hypothetical protein